MSGIVGTVDALLLYHLTATALLAILSAVLLVNLLWFRRPDGRLSQPAPFVSILVPARDEERNIEACVRSLLAQEYPTGAFEVVVGDDQSEDRTPAILAELADEAPHLRVVRPGGPPAAWLGKPWVCHALGRAADPRARWLLFTDADTRHAPDSLRRAVSAAERDGLDLLSLFPRQIARSWAERLVIPLLIHQIVGYLPLPALEHLPAPALAAANGQYMLFRRGAYRRIGGHSAVARVGADDVGLARGVKHHGGRVRLANGAGLVSCRMYRNAREVARGFGRSFAAGFRLSVPVTLGLLGGNLFLYWAPFAWLPVGLALGASWWPLVALQVTAILTLRVLLAIRGHTSRADVLWHPVGMLLLVAIQCRGLYQAFGRRRLEWKGRTYLLDGQAPEGG